MQTYIAPKPVAYEEALQMRTRDTKLDLSIHLWVRGASLNGYGWMSKSSSFIGYTKCVGPYHRDAKRTTILTACFTGLTVFVVFGVKRKQDRSQNRRATTKICIVLRMLMTTSDPATTQPGILRQYRREKYAASLPKT